MPCPSRAAVRLAALSAELALEAVDNVARGDLDNAYALSRRQASCLPETPNGAAFWPISPSPWNRRAPRGW